MPEEQTEYEGDRVGSGVRPGEGGAGAEPAAVNLPLTPRPPLPPGGEGEPEFLLPLSPWWEGGRGVRGRDSASSAQRRASLHPRTGIWMCPTCNP